MATAEEDNNIEEAPASLPEAEKPKDAHLEQDTELAPITPGIDPVIEKRVLRKLDRRLPVITGFMCMYMTSSLMCLLCANGKGCIVLLSYLDRSNIGYVILSYLSPRMERLIENIERNAAIAGMRTDLGLDSGKYAWLLTIFYISYTLFEFQALMWKVLKPHRWAAFVMFAWYVNLHYMSSRTHP